MTIASTLTKKHYEGNGITKEFPLPFHLVDKTHIFAVIKKNKEIQEVTKNFSVDLVKKIFTYPLTGEALPKGTKLTVYRKVPLTQIVDLENAGAFHPEVLENDGFDRIVMQIQQLDEEISRALKLDITDERDKEGLVDALLTARDEAVQAAINAKKSELSASKSEVNAKNYAKIAWAWAESPTPPDPKDPHSKSAKEWAKEVSKGGILASPTEAGRVCYDNVTIKAKADGKSTLYTPLLSAVSPTNAINSVTSKAIADYAAGKNVDNKLMAWNQFEHVGIQVRNAYYEIGQSNLPERNTYASIYFVDKRGLLHGVDNSLGHLVNRVTNKGYQETYLDVIKNAGSEEPLLAYLKVGLSPTNIAYATAPSAPDDWIGDYIATTAWVNKNSQVMKRLATRNVSGDVTLTNLKINVPVYVVLEKWEQWFTHSILPKKGVINGMGSKLPFHLGGTAYLALLTMHNQALMFIPNATTAIFSVTMMQDPNALIGFYQ